MSASFVSHSARRIPSMQGSWSNALLAGHQKTTSYIPRATRGTRHCLSVCRASSTRRALRCLQIVGRRQIFSTSSRAPPRGAGGQAAAFGPS